MGILCKLFDHVPYSFMGSRYPDLYIRSIYEKTPIGTRYIMDSLCRRCGEEFIVGKVLIQDPVKSSDASKFPSIMPELIENV